MTETRKPPLPDRAGALPHLDEARRLSRAVQRLHHESLRANTRLAARVGISSADFTAFLIVSGAESPTPKHLSAELGLTTSAVTALLDRLEGAALIRRAPHPNDRRSVVIELTSSGRAAKADVYVDYLGAMSTVIQGEARLGSVRTVALLDRIADAIETVSTTD